MPSSTPTSSSTRVECSINFVFSDASASQKLQNSLTHTLTDIWLCMTMCDYVWLCMTMYDYLWLFMTTMFDYVGLYMTMMTFMTIHDYVWLCMLMYDFLWLLPSSASTSTKTLAEVSLILGIIFPPTHP